MKFKNMKYLTKAGKKGLYMSYERIKSGFLSIIVFLL
jgi:hypothetical protein